MPAASNKLGLEVHWPCRAVTLEPLWGGDPLTLEMH